LGIQNKDKILSQLMFNVSSPKETSKPRLIAEY